MARNVQVKLTTKQSSAYRLLTNPEDVALLYGGAKGGAKSFLLCVWIKIWVERLIKFFDLRPSDNPVALGFVGRKRSVDFHDTTLEDFKRILPEDQYRLYDDEHEIIFRESAKVFCGGLDDPKRVKKFNSANYAFFAVDQAEETERPDVDALKGSLRLTIDGKQPPYKQLYTANPADCWLKEDFIDNKYPKHYFIPALYTDNPYLPSNYGETLTNAFRYNEALLKAYKDGDWTALQASNVLITHRMIALLKESAIYPKETKRIISCDPAMGGDECVINAMENHKVMEQIILHERDTMKVAGYLSTMANRHRTPYFIIDSIGIGQGIADRIKEVHKDAKVHFLNSSERDKKNPDAHANVRADMWWYAMQEIQDRRVPYPEDEETRKQLISPRFQVINSNGRIRLEPKEETKKRLGRSPDRADAFVMGVYGLQFTEPLKEKDGWVDDPETSEVGGGAVSAMAA